MLRQMDKNKKVYSHLDIFLSKLWQVTAASFFIGALLCMKLEIATPPIMLLIAGMATTISGLIIKYKPVIVGDMAFFIFSIAKHL
jgi:sulfite exporter TauE/SafE